MEVLHTVSEAQRFTLDRRSQGKSVGIVPTMGALHEGHLSLARASQSCDATVATIFVNPTQFGPGEDLDKYPRTLDQDCQALDRLGVDAVFVPETGTMYPAGFSTYVDPPEVSRTLEGVCRPGHFRGVATIVLKLFQAVPATHAYFGRKDFQQWRVVEAMARDLNLGIEIVGCPIIRDPDGLAMSSRNRYLSADERARALRISEALGRVEDAVSQGERRVAELESTMRRCLVAASSPQTQPIRAAGNASEEIESECIGFNAAAPIPSTSGRFPLGLDKIDYATIVAADTLSPLAEVDRPAVALIAGFVGQTRLIDNRELRIEFHSNTRIESGRESRTI